MLATLTDAPFSRPGWLFEPKLDGVRCLALRSGSDIQLLSRNQKRLNEKYPEWVDALQKQRANDFAVDGELVTFDGGITSFAKLQQRMQLRHPPEEIRRKIPGWYYIFDLLYLNGRDVRQLPLCERKTLLQKARVFKDPLRCTAYRETEGVAYFREACQKGWEGIIAKKADRVYSSGRSRDWLKFKCINEQEFVIGGYTDPKGSRTGFGALLVGFYEKGKLVNAGKVGTGFDHATLQDLHKKLRKLETDTCPFASDGFPTWHVHWVKPKLVAQIGFGEWTTAGKLRQPRFLGLRFDKDPQEVVRKG